MSQIVLFLLIGLNLVSLVLLLVLLQRAAGNNSAKLQHSLAVLEQGLVHSERVLQDEIVRVREETANQARQGREELANNQKNFSELLFGRIMNTAGMQKQQLDTFAKQLATLTQSNEQRLEQMRRTVEEKLRLLQEDNNSKLEQMRTTVDEKLHATLEKRLGESFKLVSERLEQVHKGLGEMQSLAAGVGDLKRVMTNIKTRGTWGEVQLENLLEQILTPEQYAKNVATKQGSNDRVEFAVKLPAKDGSDKVIWLPLDAKFPLEDYQRLLEAQEQANQPAVLELGKALVQRIKSEAKMICDKYLDPPHTTDFGILFLPIEGLYAEVLRQPGLVESLQRDYRVVITGPTTVAALLNSLQMGFKTLAIEKRSSEVWALLGAVKSEFGKFGDLLEKTQRKLQEASNSIETAARKSRTIERKLRDVQELPSDEAANLLEGAANPETEAI
ncbi:MAG TPA: DNA recombination protein RmuC [Desulfobacteria bacterium]|nr:DNA recombination protein RmuC [Desulfobacteria bacterium]